MMSVPNNLARLLSRAIGRVRRIYLLRGLAAVGVVWILAVVAVMVADSRLVIFDDRLRWAMTGGILLLVLLTAAAAIVWPLCRRIDFRKMAKVLDARHPEFEERFTTLVELSESDADATGFSLGLFSLICRLADDDIAKVDLAREFPLVGALRRLGVLLFLLLTLGIGIAVSPNLVGRLFVRAVAPWVDVGNLYANDIVVQPGDLVALVGTVIRIEATADESLHAEPTLRLSRRQGAGWTEETTEPMPNGVYETTADVNEKEWRYRVNAGPAVTRYYRVRVSEKPKYESFTARVEYPEYTLFAPAVYSNDEVSAIRAIEGSRVKFDLKVTEEGTVSDFRIGGKHVFEHTMVSNRTSEWSLELVNRDGFRSSMGKHPLTSYQDQAPTLVIESPAGQLPKLPPHAKIHVELTASDDVGVARPDIRYSIDGAEMGFFKEVDEFASAGGNLWRGSADLDLATLDLVNARNVRFDILAHDFCPEEYGGPHLVTSSVINVNLEYHEWGFEVADLREQAKESNALVDDAKKRLKDAENLTRQLREELKRDGKVSEATERKNETAAHEASEAAKRVEELRDRLANDERFAPLAKPLEKVLGEQVKPALEKIENAQFRDREERAEEMAKAADELKKAQEQMDELAKRLKERTEKLDAFEKAKDLAIRQESLARTAQQLLEERPVDTAKLEAWKRLEEEAMRRTEELAKAHPDADLAEARRKMETAARKIEELKKALAEAEKEKAAEKAAAEKKAAAEREAAVPRDNALAQAGEEQKRAEEAQAKGDAKATADAQKKAERKLAEAQAIPAVKALQKLATEAQEEAPGDLAKKIQKEASAARAKEQAIREGIKEGKKSEKDLDALDAALRKELPKQTAEVAAAQAEKAADGATAQTEKAEKTAKEDPAEAAKAAARQAAAEAQRKASNSLKEAGDRRASERRLRHGDKQQAAAEMAKMAEGLERQAAEQQKKAAENLKAGEATEGVRAMQDLAQKAAEAAQKEPRSAEKAVRAQVAQQAAAEALREEQAVREAMKRGEKTAADLEALDRGLRQVAKDKADEMAEEDASAAQREKASAERASRQAKELKEAATAEAQAHQAMQQAAARRDEERKLRDAKNVAAADQKAREAERFEAQAAEAQRSAEDHLERAEAMPSVKAMQKRATDLERLAREAPHTAEKSAEAVRAQEAAAEALKREQAIREGMRKGDRTTEDLLGLEKELNEGLLQKAAERKASARRAAAQASQEAREAIGTKETDEIDALADKALQAKRDELAAELSEAELTGDAQRAEALRDAEDALDAVKAEDAEKTAREDRILALQQSAAEAFERGDRNRARDLQREIGKAQERAAESAGDDSEEAEAREEANEAQEEAAEAGAEAQRNWNNETKAAAAKAQRGAMEKEKAAHEAARASRAMEKIAAAEKNAESAEGGEQQSGEGEQKSDEQQSGEGQQQSAQGQKEGEAGASEKKETADAAQAASDAMDREVKAQAAALGLKNADSKGQGQGKSKDKDKKGGGGGGVNDELDKLARELKRGDPPDFFKKLFSRLGWFKIHGVSKDGLRERDLTDVPREYRDLVRRYFLKLAEENPEPEKKSP